MAAKQTKQGGIIVNLRDRVEMTATETHPGYKAGAQFTVHREQVKRLVENKWAVDGHVTLPATKTTPKAEKVETK